MGARELSPVYFSLAPTGRGARGEHPTAGSDFFTAFLPRGDFQESPGSKISMPLKFRTFRKPQSTPIQIYNSYASYKTTSHPGWFRLFSDEGDEAHGFHSE